MGILCRGTIGLATERFLWKVLFFLKRVTGDSVGRDR